MAYSKDEILDPATIKSIEKLICAIKNLEKAVSELPEWLRELLIHTEYAPQTPKENKFQRRMREMMDAAVKQNDENK